MAKKKSKIITTLVYKDSLGFYPNGCERPISCGLNIIGMVFLGTIFEYDFVCESEITVSPGDEVPTGWPDRPLALEALKLKGKDGYYYVAETVESYLLKCKCCDNKPSYYSSYYYGDDGGIGGDNLDLYNFGLSRAYNGFPLNNSQALNVTAVADDDLVHTIVVASNITGSGSGSLHLNKGYTITLSAEFLETREGLPTYEIKENGVVKNDEWVFDGTKYFTKHFDAGTPIPNIVFWFNNYQSLTVLIETQFEDGGGNKMLLRPEMVSGIDPLVNWGDGVINSSYQHYYTDPGQYEVTIYKIREVSYVAFEGSNLADGKFVSLLKLWERCNPLYFRFYNGAYDTLSPAQVEQILGYVDANTPTGLLTIQIDSFDPLDLTAPSLVSKASLEGKGITVNIHV